MIKTLSIKNFALIDELELDLDKGLNILAGETGAGKSILIDAIDLVFGTRASKEHIKTGTKKSTIELTIKYNSKDIRLLLLENDIEPEDDNTLIISREITASSSKSRVNGVIVTRNYIQILREYLIDIHSQHETYIYIQPKTHINLLDNYGDKSHKDLITAFEQKYNEFKANSKELERLLNERQSIEQRIDFLMFQVMEIESANIENTEEYDELNNQRLKLVNAKDLKELTYFGYHCLYNQENSLIDMINCIELKLIKACDMDKNLGNIADSIANSSSLLKDAADELRSYSENIDNDPQLLNEIEERILLLDKLKRKYGPDLSDVINNFALYQEELNKIQTDFGNIDGLQEKNEQLQTELKKIAKLLSESRTTLAKALSKKIKTELVKLEMPKVQFNINVMLKDDYNSSGLDDVEFMVSANPGEPLKPLAKVASGGEISRIMLAIKTVFAQADKVNTVIFDEIDTGVSGKTSQAIGEELVNLSFSHQVLCITHQPIIAAMADRYFYVEKHQNKEKTSVSVSILNEEQKIKAISKLASGSGEDQDSRNFVIKLINQAVNYKKLNKIEREMKTTENKAKLL